MKSSKEVTPNDETLRYYFYFVQERMNMFWRKVEGKFIYTCLLYTSDAADE